MISIIGTYQSISNPDTLAKLQPQHFKLVMVDEAHHSVAPS